MRIFLILCLVVYSSVSAFAQNPAESHNHATSLEPVIIDGSAHPELIPDSSAYRMWFSAVSLVPSATDEEKATQRRLLSPLELGSGDYTALTELLATFNGRFEILINTQAENARLAFTQLRPVDDEDFFASRDALVAEIREAIKFRLNPAAVRRIDEYVQGEKRNMKRTERSEQQYWSCARSGNCPSGLVG